MRESCAAALDIISIRAPEQPMPTPRAFFPVMGSLSISAESIMAKMGSDVVTMLAFEGVVMLSPMVKQHWLPTSPSSPAPLIANTSRQGMCSCLHSSEVSQNSNAPPAARIKTRFMLSMPCCIASLPMGDISPHMTHAMSMHKCAIRGRLLSVLNVIFCLFCYPFYQIRVQRYKNIVLCEYNVSIYFIYL